MGWLLKGSRGTIIRSKNRKNISEELTKKIHTILPTNFAGVYLGGNGHENRFVSCLHEGALFYR
jgi:hypothetical protein